MKRVGKISGKTKRKGDDRHASAVKLAIARMRSLKPFYSSDGNRLLKHTDEKDNSVTVLEQIFGCKADQIPKEVSFTRETMRGMLDKEHVYVIDIGAYSALSMTAASVLRFSTLGTSSGYGWIPMSAGVSGSIYSADLNAIGSLFDEFKTEFISIHYEPSNPYNRGATTLSYPISLFYDDENVTDVGVTSDTSSIGDRGENVQMFSLDHTFRHVFARPRKLSEYPWAAQAPSVLTVVNGWSGVVCFAYNSATLTASTRYGTTLISFRMHCRFRI